VDGDVDRVVVVLVTVRLLCAVHLLVLLRVFEVKCLVSIVKVLLEELGDQI